MRPRPFLIAFLVGALVFATPAYMLLQREPCIETTDFHMEPSTVASGQKFVAVWTDRTLRAGCNGMLNRRFIATNGIDIWVFPPAHTVHHGAVGSTSRFHTPWIAPDAPPGTDIVFRKDIQRWSNPIQKWVWPMEEAQEAPFSIVEPAQEPRRP